MWPNSEEILFRPECHLKARLPAEWDFFTSKSLAFPLTGISTFHCPIFPSPTPTQRLPQDRLMSSPGTLATPGDLALHPQSRTLDLGHAGASEGPAVYLRSHGAGLCGGGRGVCALSRCAFSNTCAPQWVCLSFHGTASFFRIVAHLTQASVLENQANTGLLDCELHSLPAGYPTFSMCLCLE